MGKVPVRVRIRKAEERVMQGLGLVVISKKKCKKVGIVRVAIVTDGNCPGRYYPGGIWASVV